jgi:3',5'-cyclic AMP phosphodiesterase CpdA
MQIALISDTHLAPNAPAFRANCDAARAWIAALAPDLTVHLGDITADAAKDPTHYAEALDAFAAWPTPLRFLPGNHDVGDNRDEARHGDDPPIDAVRLARYQAAFGPDRWSLEAEGWTIVGLNAQLFGWEGPEQEDQFSWLEEVLAHADGPLGVMLHKPLFRDGPSDTERHHRYLPGVGRARLLGLLRGHDLRFVLCGHTHQTRRCHLDGVEHVWAPSTAFLIPDRLQERIGDKIMGTMLLTLTPDAHRFTLVGPTGLTQRDLLDHADVYPQLAGLRAAVRLSHT